MTCECVSCLSNSTIRIYRVLVTAKSETLQIFKTFRISGRSSKSGEEPYEFITIQEIVLYIGYDRGQSVIHHVLYAKECCTSDVILERVLEGAVLYIGEWSTSESGIHRRVQYI